MPEHHEFAAAKNSRSANEPIDTLDDLRRYLLAPSHEADSTAQFPKNLLKTETKIPADAWAPPPPDGNKQLRDKTVNETKTQALKQPEQQSRLAIAEAFSHLGTVQDRASLDLMRLKLSVSTGKTEQADHKTEITNYATLKSQGKISDQSIAALTNGGDYHSVLKEINTARPQDSAKLINEARSNMLTEAEKAIADPHKYATFKEHVEQFDKRATERNLSDEQRLLLYLQVGRVLDPSAKFEHGDKTLIARSLMANAAEPTTIDQGHHNTCNVTTLEVRMFAQEPGTAAKVVADLVSAGEFVAADGTKVRPQNLEADNEAKEDPTRNGARNYASQLWQLTAINAYWGRREVLPGGKTVGKGNIAYAQADGQEFLLDMSQNPPQKQQFKTVDAGQPWLDIYGVSQISEQLTGHPSKDFGIVRWFYPSESAGVTKVLTLNGFKERLSELKKADAFPVIIEVDAAKKPFGEDKGYGLHVVNITDYDPQTGLVSVDNQWGTYNDFTGLPGQKPKQDVETVWHSMNQVPGTDYFYNTIKDDLKDYHWKESISPAVSALSLKGLRWGLSETGTTAIRGGLGYLSEAGIPGAAGLFEATESGIGKFALRSGTGLLSLGAFAYINDVPGAFRQGTAHGLGKMSRVTLDWASFEIGKDLVNKGLSMAGAWAPLRIGAALASGYATSAISDRLLGDGAEIGTSEAYTRLCDYIKPNSPLAHPEKSLKQEIKLPVEPDPTKSLRDAKHFQRIAPPQNMTDQFIQRYKQMDELKYGK